MFVLNEKVQNAVEENYVVEERRYSLKPRSARLEMTYSKNVHLSTATAKEPQGAI